MDRRRPYFSKCRGRARVDDSRVFSRIVFINRNGVNDGSGRRLEETSNGRFKTLTGGAQSEGLYKRRNRIKRMFSQIKDWRRIATHYDSSPTVFLFAIILAAKLYFGYES
jgi:transposase